MSLSSAESKRSFASSKLRAVSESRGLGALQRSLRFAFIAFAAAIVAFACLGSGGTVLQRLAAAIVPALGAMSIVLLFALAAALARAFALDAYAMCVAAGAAFTCAFSSLQPAAIGAVAAFRTLGSSGIFLAILIGFAVAGAALALRRAGLSAAIATWCGGICVALVFAGIAAAGVSTSALLVALLRPLGGLGDSYAALLTIVLVETLLWTIGIHGPALLAAILTPVYLTLQSQNAEAFAHGLPLPHIVTISTFLFVFPGGAGATLPLVVMMLFSRASGLRKLAYATVGPSFCGVNEPLLFGLPVVMEPILAIPFVAVPVVLSATTYAAMASGLVARPAYYIPAVVPPVLNAFLATADWRACVLAIVNLVVGAAIYFPFLRLYERSRARRAAA